MHQSHTKIIALSSTLLLSACEKPNVPEKIPEQTLRVQATALDARSLAREFRHGLDKISPLAEYYGAGSSGVYDRSPQTAALVNLISQSPHVLVPELARFVRGNFAGDQRPAALALLSQLAKHARTNSELTRTVRAQMLLVDPYFNDAFTAYWFWADPPTALRPPQLLNQLNGPQQAGLLGELQTQLTAKPFNWLVTYFTFAELTLSDLDRLDPQQRRQLAQSANSIASISLSNTAPFKAAEAAVASKVAARQLLPQGLTNFTSWAKSWVTADSGLDAEDRTVKALLASNDRVLSLVARVALVLDDHQLLSRLAGGPDFFLYRTMQAFAEYESNPAYRHRAALMHSHLLAVLKSQYTETELVDWLVRTLESCDKAAIPHHGYFMDQTTRLAARDFALVAIEDNPGLAQALAALIGSRLKYELLTADKQPTVKNLLLHSMIPKGEIGGEASESLILSLGDEQLAVPIAESNESEFRISVRFTPRGGWRIYPKTRAALNVAK